MGKRPTLETQLSDLTALVHTMGDRVLAGLGVLIAHLESPVKEELIKLALADTEVDNLERAIDDAVLQILATQQPMGFDLRFVQACSKIANYLERMGDASESLARQLGSLEQTGHNDIILRMLRDTRDLFERSYGAMFEADTARIRDLNVLDDKVDTGQRELYLIAKDMLHAQTSPRDVESALQLINIGTRIEKLADLCCHWAEQIEFARQGSGRSPSAPRTKYKVVLLDNTGGFAAALAGSLLFDAVKDIVDISVATRSSDAPVSLLDYSNVLERAKVTPHVFPVVKMGAVHWRKILLVIELGRIQLESDELELIPYKAVRLTWPEIEFESDALRDNARFEHYAPQYFATVEKLRQRIEDVSHLIARSQATSYL